MVLLRFASGGRLAKLQEQAQKRYVIDASVGVKWFTQMHEDDIEAALWLQELHLNKLSILAVPDLFFYELANALRYNADFTEDDLVDASTSLMKMNLDAYPPSNTLMVETLRIARNHDVTVYDTSYLALAQLLGCICVTADTKFYRKVKTIPQLVQLKELALSP